MQKLLSRIDIDRLVEASSSPAVSMYLPTHRFGPEIQQDPIRLKNLMRQTEQRLEALGLRSPEAAEILEPAKKLHADGLFWHHQREGLAVFLSKGFDAHYRLPIRFDELVVVSERFHVKPLLPFLTGDGRFYVLALSQNHLRLLEGSRHSVSEVDVDDLPKSLKDALGEETWQATLQFHTGAPSAGGERAAVFHGHGAGGEEKDELLRFFRRVDAALTDFLGDDRSPLVLAGIEHYFPIYREANNYPGLVDGGVAGNPDSASADELHDRALALVAPLFEKERNAAAARYRELAGTGKTSNDVAETVAAAVDGRVESLFVAVGRQLWGRLDSDARRVVVHERAEPNDVDLLDLAAVRALQKGGKVYAVEPDAMPDGAPAAAVLRY